MSENWRDDGAYDYFETLDVGDLAWECLRRNSDYRTAYPHMNEREVASWGLRFPD